MLNPAIKKNTSQEASPNTVQGHLSKTSLNIAKHAPFIKNIFLNKKIVLLTASSSLLLGYVHYKEPIHSTCNKIFENTLESWSWVKQQVINSIEIGSTLKERNDILKKMLSVEQNPPTTYFQMATTSIALLFLGFQTYFTRDN